MRRWEYRTVTISYDKKRKDWVTEASEMPAVLGLQAILEEHGLLGWELIDLHAERLQAFVQFGSYAVQPETYRATFKRMVED